MSSDAKVAEERIEANAHLFLDRHAVPGERLRQFLRGDEAAPVVRPLGSNRRKCIRRRICLGQGMAIVHGRTDAGRMSARDLDPPGRGVDADDLGAPAGDGFAQ